MFAPDSPNVPDGVLILDKETGNVPHDWLFNHVSAVCHHGGAGTVSDRDAALNETLLIRLIQVSAGLKAGKPTIVVPFFGDQVGHSI